MRLPSPRAGTALLAAAQLLVVRPGSGAGQERTAEAEIAVELVDSSARVEATYRLAGRPPLELSTLRASGQEVEGPGVEAGPLVPEVERKPALVRVRARVPADSADFYHRYFRSRLNAGPPTWEVRISYRVTGDLDRIPVFVPAFPTDLDSRLEIRIRGLDPEADLGGAFPRFEWAGEGSGPEGGAVAVARPPNLPTFAVLPARTAPLTLNEAADLLVVVVVVGATGGWLLWRRREARRLRTGRDGRRIRSEADPRGAGEA